MGFVKTDSILDKILAHKQEELRREFYDMGGPLDGGPAWQAQVRHYAESAPPARDFAAALRRDTVALIAEAKKASPSKGVLLPDFDPVRLGMVYADNGAAAVSVLTDEHFFQGHLSYLRDVRAVVPIPVLRKDFIIDPHQVNAARASLADAVLLIAAALEDSQMADLHAQITDLGMAALVEVHDEREAERALKLDASLIGINNRNLRTFKVDLNTTARLAKMMPDSVTLVAESGIQSAQDVRFMGQQGADAVLVGEALVTAVDTAATVRDFSAQPR